MIRVDFIDNNKVDREKLKELMAPFDGFLAIVLTEFNKAIAIVVPEGFKEIRKNKEIFQIFYWIDDDKMIPCANTVDPYPSFFESGNDIIFRL